MICQKRRLKLAGDAKAVAVYIWCPGCETLHSFYLQRDDPGDTWTWNNSPEAPTFAPSLLVNKHDPKSRCHSFVTDGKIKFLGDCFHGLKNTTVPLPDLPDWFVED